MNDWPLRFPVPPVYGAPCGPLASLSCLPPAYEPFRPNHCFVSRTQQTGLHLLLLVFFPINIHRIKTYSSFLTSFAASTQFASIFSSMLSSPALISSILWSSSSRRPCNKSIYCYFSLNLVPFLSSGRTIPTLSVQPFSFVLPFQPHRFPFACSSRQFYSENRKLRILMNFIDQPRNVRRKTRDPGEPWLALDHTPTTSFWAPHIFCLSRCDSLATENR